MQTRWLSIHEPELNVSLPGKGLHTTLLSFGETRNAQLDILTLVSSKRGV